MDVKARRAMSGRWRRLARLAALGALALVILACGASLRPEMIPAATLEPGVPAFRVVSLAGATLQARAGRDGTLQWQTPISSVDDARLTTDADGHTVYVSETSAPKVIAVSADDGHILWQFAECTGPDTRLLLGQGRLYLTCGNGSDTTPDEIAQATLYALDAQTGAVLWTGIHQHAEALSGANIIVQTTTGVAALNGATGAILWQHSVAISAEIPGIPSPEAPYDTFRFSVRVGPAGLYYSPDGLHAEALRASDGALLWTSGPLQDFISAPNGRYVQHATIALATADEIVTQGVYGVTVLRVRDGTILWRYYQYPDGGGISTLVGDDGAVYVADFSDDAVATPDPKGGILLAALNPRDGSVRWDMPSGAANHHPLLLLDGDTLITAEPDEISAYSTADGTRRWQQQGVFPNYLVANAQVLCVQAGALLYMLKMAGGLKVWKQQLPASGPTPPLLLPA